MYNCKKCDQVFEKPTQLAHHMSWDHGNARMSILQKKEAREREYLEHPSLCLQCFSVISYSLRKNKFCCSSCSATYNNSRRVSENERFEVCEHCGKQFTKPTWTPRKFCSRKCNVAHKKQEYTESWLQSGKLGNWTGGQTGCAPRCKSVLTLLNEEQGNKCEICGCTNVWEEKPLVFILDHIDGDSTNNNRENLRLICPNCNSQTSTFSGRNKGKGRKAKGFYAAIV